MEFTVAAPPGASTLASRQLRCTLYPAETKLNHGHSYVGEFDTSGTTRELVRHDQPVDHNEGDGV